MPSQLEFNIGFAIDFSTLEELEARLKKISELASRVSQIKIDVNFDEVIEKTAQMEKALNSIVEKSESISGKTIKMNVDDSSLKNVVRSVEEVSKKTEGLSKNVEVRSVKPEDVLSKDLLRYETNWEGLAVSEPIDTDKISKGRKEVWALKKEYDEIVNKMARGDFITGKELERVSKFDENDFWKNWEKVVKPKKSPYAELPEYAREKPFLDIDRYAKSTKLEDLVDTVKVFDEWKNTIGYKSEFDFIREHQVRMPWLGTKEPVDYNFLGASLSGLSEFSKDFERTMRLQERQIQKEREMRERREKLEQSGVFGKTLLKLQDKVGSISEYVSRKGTKVSGMDRLISTEMKSVLGIFGMWFALKEFISAGKQFSGFFQAMLKLLQAVIGLFAKPLLDVIGASLIPILTKLINIAIEINKLLAPFIKKIYHFFSSHGWIGAIAGAGLGLGTTLLAGYGLLKGIGVIGRLLLSPILGGTGGSLLGGVAEGVGLGAIGSKIAGAVTGVIGGIGAKLGGLGAVATKVSGITSILYGLYQGYQGYKSAKEWGVSKWAGALGSFIAGNTSMDLIKTDKKAWALNVGANTLKWAGIGAMLGSVVPGVGTAIGAGIGGLFGAVSGVVGGQGYAKVFDFTASKISDALSSVKNGLEGVADDIKSAGSSFKSMVESAGGSLKSGLGSVGRYLMGGLSSVKDFIVGGDKGESVKGLVSGLSGSVATPLIGNQTVSGFDKDLKSILSSISKSSVINQNNTINVNVNISGASLGGADGSYTAKRIGEVIGQEVTEAMKKTGAIPSFSSSLNNLISWG